MVRRQIPTEPAGVLANTSQALRLQFLERSDTTTGQTRAATLSKHFGLMFPDPLRASCGFNESSCFSCLAVIGPGPAIY